MSAATTGASPGERMLPGSQLPPGMSLSPNVIFQDLPLVPNLAKTHGILMGLVFVVIFPVGSFLIRFPRIKSMVWFHVACQVVGWGMMLGGLAVGIRTGKILDRLHNNAHTILGTVVVAALVLQPFLGFIHHWRFVKTNGRTVWSTIHKWYGRIFIILGIIAGGSGLALASGSPAYSKPGMITYAVLASISVVALLGLWGWVEVKNRGTNKSHTEGSVTNGV